jgi:hypothetical protein
VAKEKESQADVLLGLAETADLFHTPDGRGFADIEVAGHRETWPIRSKHFRGWLARAFFENVHGAPNSEAMSSTLNVIEARARFDSPQRIVVIRMGGLNDCIYVDLCDERWRAIEVDGLGWRIIDRPPVRFRRPAGMQPLPMPAPGGSINALRAFLNISGPGFVLAVTWVLSALRNNGPYPVLVLSGEQGSTKSTFCRVLRSLVDPNTAPLRALPRDDRDLFIAANNGHVLAFDNVSSLPSWLADTFCRLATGGGFATRQLYTDLDEVLFDSTRPIILNGIEDVVTRPDLSDRALQLILDPIPEEQRQPEQHFWAAFEQERARIFGALVDTVAHALAVLPRPNLSDSRAWQISLCGQAHVRAACGLPGHSCPRITAIAITPSKISSTPTQSPARCAPLWRE